MVDAKVVQGEATLSPSPHSPALALHHLRTPLPHLHAHARAQASLFSPASKGQGRLWRAGFSPTCREAALRDSRTGLATHVQVQFTLARSRACVRHCADETWIH